MISNEDDRYMKIVALYGIEIEWRGTLEKTKDK
jgi:hypothetical protein